MKTLSLFVIAALFMPAAVLAQRLIEVPVGGAETVSMGGVSGKVKITDPSVAAVERFGSDVIVLGRKLGETNLLLSSSDTSESWLIKVHLPVKAIQNEVERSFKGQDITVRAVGGSIVLNGVVQSVPTVTQVEAVVMGYLESPNLIELGVQPKVINLLQVKTRQQVQLEVKFAEVDRKSMREIGVNFAAQSTSGDMQLGARSGANGTGGLYNFGDDSSYTDGTQTLSQQSSTAGPAVVRATSTNSAFGTFFFGMNGDAFPFVAALNLLTQSSLSRTLAEPILVAMSGQEASFLAGGEIPFQVTTGLGTSNVQFKPYGVELKFNPTVLENDTIQLQTTVSMSAPDSSESVQGTIGFKRRATSTTVRMRDGQSFAISGMLTDEMSNVVREVPGLGSLPILGVLFKSKAYERQETELIVVVTARLVDPLEAEDMPPLPGEDMLSDPNDVQLFLLNVDETDKKKSMRKRRPRRPAGSVGFTR
jgi:pilus assembly protein CpaC